MSLSRHVKKYCLNGADSANSTIRVTLTHDGYFFEVKRESAYFVASVFSGLVAFFPTQMYRPDPVSRMKQS